MTGYTLANGRAVCEAYDFTGFARIIDVGGGVGLFAAMIHDSAPQSEVVLFDLPHVIEEAKRKLATDKTSDGLRLVGGNMFQALPGPADALVLKAVVCD